MAHSQLRMPWTLPFHTQEVPHQGVSLLVGPSLRAHRAIATRQLMHLGNSVVLTRLVDLLSDVIEVTHICGCCTSAFEVDSCCVGNAALHRKAKFECPPKRVT